MRLFDTHAHYDADAFDADRMELLASMPARGVELILNPGCDLISSQKAVELADAFPYVYAAVGVHPSDCGGWTGCANWRPTPRSRRLEKSGWTIIGRRIPPVPISSRYCTSSWSWQRNWVCPLSSTTGRPIRTA